MRDLKFRIWDSFNAVMMRQEEDRYVDSLCKIWVDYDILINGENDPIMMQFVGLKDKKGIEIFEGDILKVGENLVFEVRFCDGVEEYQYEKYAGCFLLSNKGYSMPFDEYAIDNCFVIGNKYENPELL